MKLIIFLSIFLLSLQASTKDTFLKDLNASETYFKKETDEFKKIKGLNDFFLQHFTYKSDLDHYKINDIWNSYNEMIDTDFEGDCEDFTFAKIKLAKRFGISFDKILIGETLTHMFPIFIVEDKKYVSDTSGLFNWERHATLYPNATIYTIEEFIKNSEYAKAYPKELQKADIFN